MIPRHDRVDDSCCFEVTAERLGVFDVICSKVGVSKILVFHDVAVWSRFDERGVAVVCVGDLGWDLLFALAAWDVVLLEGGWLSVARGLGGF